MADIVTTTGQNNTPASSGNDSTGNGGFDWGNVFDNAGDTLGGLSKLILAFKGVPQGTPPATTPPSTNPVSGMGISKNTWTIIIVIIVAILALVLVKILRG